MERKKQGAQEDKASERQYENNNTTPEDIKNAHAEADKDIANDPDFNAQSPNDDLDEGETARLGENTDLI